MSREERKNTYRKLCTEKKITSLFMQPWWLDASGEWDVSFALRNEQLSGAMPLDRTQWGVSISDAVVDPLWKYGSKTADILT